MVFLYPYLDDVLIRSMSRAQATRDVWRTVACLQDHRFVVDLHKSSLKPSQCLEHLGLLLGTGQAQYSLSAVQQQKIWDLTQAMLAEGSPDVLALAGNGDLMPGCHQMGVCPLLGPPAPAPTLAGGCGEGEPLSRATHA